MSDDNERPKGGAGYGRPPVEHRFKPGVSGNPKGRPKKPERSYTKRQVYLDFMDASNEEVKVGGRTMTKGSLVMKNLVASAFKGDASSIKMYFRFLIESTDGLYAENPDLYSFLRQAENQVLSGKADELTARMLPELRRRTRRR